MQAGISETFPLWMEGIVHQRNSEDHNLCEEIIGHYRYHFTKLSAVKQLIEDLQKSVEMYELQEGHK